MVIEGPFVTDIREGLPVEIPENGYDNYKG